MRKYTPRKSASFAPHESSFDMLFVVHRLQELGQARKIPLYMCFINLHRAYNSVDRELLWVVLACSRVPKKTVTVINQFHDGMQARLRTDDCGCSEWLEVTHGLRQRYVLSPPLFNVFFAAAIHAVLVCSSENPGILRDLVHLDDGVGGNAEPLDRVRSAVWGVLYADDAGIVSKAAADLAKIMTAVMNVFVTAGLTVLERKAETVLQRKPNQAPLTSPLAIEVVGQRYNQIVQFLYLGGLSTRPATLCQRSNDESDSRGHASIGSSYSCTIWRSLRSR